MSTLNALREGCLTAARANVLLIFLATVAVYGGTQAGSRPQLEALLLAIGVFYFAAKCLSSESWSVSKWPLLLTALLVGAGWAAAMCPSSMFDRQQRLFLPVDHNSSMFWSSVDGNISQQAMYRITGVVLFFWAFFDMAAQRAWRQRMMTGIALAGGGVALWGISQRIWGDLGNYWGVRDLPPNVFGPFWYHGNAGAFLNLCWPVFAVLVWQRARRVNASTSSVRDQLVLAGWVLLFLATISAVWINLSRAAQGIFVIEGALLGVVGICNRQRTLEVHERNWRAPLLIATVLGTIALLAALAGLWPNEHRWGEFIQGTKLAEDLRWKAAGIIIEWLPQLPLLGFGPGTFSAVFVVNTTGVTGAPYGYWEFAHNDYLQTLVEWGWVGLAGWLALAGWIGAASIRALVSADPGDGLVRSGALVGLMSLAFHAAVDFPLQIPALQLACAGLCAIAAAPLRERRRIKRPRRPGQDL